MSALTKATIPLGLLLDVVLSRCPFDHTYERTNQLDNDDDSSHCRSDQPDDNERRHIVGPCNGGAFHCKASRSASKHVEWLQGKRGAFLGD